MDTLKQNNCSSVTPNENFCSLLCFVIVCLRGLLEYLVAFDPIRSYASLFFQYLRLVVYLTVIIDLHTAYLASIDVIEAPPVLGFLDFKFRLHLILRRQLILDPSAYLERYSIALSEILVRRISTTKQTALNFPSTTSQSKGSAQTIHPKPTCSLHFPRRNFLPPQRSPHAEC